MKIRTQNCMEELQQKFWQNDWENFGKMCSLKWKSPHYDGDKKSTIFKEWDPISLQIREGILDFSTFAWDY
jgi:hypothetical protein